MKRKKTKEKEKVGSHKAECNNKHIGDFA